VASPSATSAGNHSGRPVKGRLPFEAVVPRTPLFDAGAVDAAGDVEAAGEVEAEGEVDADGDDDVLGVDECVVARTTLLVDGAVLDVLFVAELFVVELFTTELFVVELLVVELFVTELFVVELLVTLVFVVELVLELVLEPVVVPPLVEVELQFAVLKLFTACQSRMCRLPGHGATLCGWLLPGP